MPKEILYTENIGLEPGFDDDGKPVLLPVEHFRVVKCTPKKVQVSGKWEQNKLSTSIIKLHFGSHAEIRHALENYTWSDTELAYDSSKVSHDPSVEKRWNRE